MKIFLLGLFAGIVLSLSSCNKSSPDELKTELILRPAESGKWRQMLDENNISLIGMVYFSIGSKGYCINQQTNEVYKYDANDNQVKKLENNFPGLRREKGATAFTIGNRGYYGFGENTKRILNGIYAYQYPDHLVDFWEFNPDAETWTKKADLPVRSITGYNCFDGAYGFGIGTTGYVGSGRNVNNSILNLWFSYNQATGNWSSLGNSAVAYPLGYAQVSMAFSTESRGYVGDSVRLFELNPSGLTWTQITPSAASQLPVAYKQPFVSLGSKTKGYIYGSVRSTNALKPELLNGFWEFNPVTRSWKALEEYKGEARGDCVGFILKRSDSPLEKVYIGFGSNLKASVLQDIWEYTPL